MTEQTLKQFPSNEKELELLRMTFKDNEYLLKLMRSIFFGFPLTDEEKNTLKSTFTNQPLKEAVRKKIYPLLSNEVPIGQVADFWMGTEMNVFGTSPEVAHQAIASKQKVLEMLVYGMSLLDNPDQKPIDLTFNPNYEISGLIENSQIWLLARNLYIRTIETGLNFIKIAADQNVQTPAEVKKKALQDSNK